MQSCLSWTTLPFGKTGYMYMDARRRDYFKSIIAALHYMYKLLLYQQTRAAGWLVGLRWLELAKKDPSSATDHSHGLPPSSRRFQSVLLLVVL